MSNLIQTLASIKNPNNRFIEQLDKIQGYSEEEIAQMQRLYNISIHGQFKELLLTMGKCSGGLLFGDDIYIYNKNYKPDDEFGGINADQDEWLYNEFKEFKEFTKDISLKEKQFFVFAGLNEHMVKYFLLTANNDDIIYEHDTNAETVKPFGTLFDFLIDYRRWSTSRITGKERNYFKELTTGRLLQTQPRH